MSSMASTEERMRHGQVLISVWNCRAAISRYEANQGGFSVVEAQNWQELEDTAISEVEEQGGAITMSGHYQVSSELAAQAHFEDEPLLTACPWCGAYHEPHLIEQ